MLGSPLDERCPTKVKVPFSQKWNYLKVFYRGYGLDPTSRFYLPTDSAVLTSRIYNQGYKITPAILDERKQECVTLRALALRSIFIAGGLVFGTKLAFRRIMYTGRVSHALLATLGVSWAITVRFGYEHLEDYLSDEIAAQIAKVQPTGTLAPK